MTPTELKAVLDLHLKWINNEQDGKRAYLQRADLRGANLTGATIVTGWKIVKE